MLNLNLLNKEQLEAVQTTEGPLLVLAGAGSGKTRVLTYRIANLVENHGVPPWAILALTFTNKAAREMRERIESLLSEDSSDMWVTTFHSFCAKILRFDIDKLGYDNRFVIYDEQDQTSLITDLMKSCNIDEKKLPKGAIKAKISEAKNSSEAPETYILQSGDGSDKLIDLYRAYQKRLKECNALDFDDLLLKGLELLEKCPDVLQKYRRKFRYVLVDEYQDTNHPQYRIVQLICKEHQNICVVGDDDQSIYGWRGADIRNILEFEKDFKSAKVIRLEQNYRSTKAILDCANKIIVHNTGRKGKNLWTAKPGGQPVEFKLVDNERDEAYSIARTISEQHRFEKRSYNDFAILYRTHAQSRIIESVLATGFGIPLTVIGGTRFYSRREVKDLLCYIKLIANPNDDVSFKRIINVPKRGIGDTTIKTIEMAASTHDMSMFMICAAEGMLPPRVSSKIKPFIDLMREFFAKRYELGLDSLMEFIIDKTGYIEYITAQDDDKSDDRQENIEELVGAMREHEQQSNDGDDALQSFLEIAALNTETDNIDESDGTVKLMTLHCAKGLEFPVVFIPGMEQDIFPSSRSKNDPTRVEEERRLCYVGVTRAMEKLYLYAARERHLYGSIQRNDPSIFLEEMELIDPETVPMRRNSFGSASSFFRDGSAVQNAVKYAKQNGYVSGGQTPRVSEDVLSEIRRINGLAQKPGTVRPYARQSVSSGSTGYSPNKSKPRVRLCSGQRVSHPQFGKGTVAAVDEGSGIVTVKFDTNGVRKLAAAYAPLKVITEE